MFKIIADKFSRLSIRKKILLLVSLFGFIMISFYTYYVYENNSSNIIKTIDEKLIDGAYATDLICGSSFHEKISGPGSVSEAEHMENIKRLNVLVKQLGLKYLYTMVEDGGRIYYASSSATEEELRDGSYSPFYQECKEVSQALKDAYKTKTTFFEEYTTRWGSFRSVYMARQTAGGRVYFIGADVTLEHIESKLFNSLWTSILSGILIYCVFISITFFIVGSITKPIKQLADSAKKISEGDYKTSINLNTHDETRLLADTINTMLVNINTSLDNLALEKINVERRVEDAVRQSEEQKSYLAHSVESILDAMERFSRGDLTVNLKSTQNDLIGNLFKGFNKTVENFKQMVLDVRNAVKETTLVGEQISTNAEEMAAGSLQQAQQATEITSSIEEMTKTIMQNTKNAGMASSTAHDAGEKARQGGKAVSDTIDEMDKIADVVIVSAAKVSELSKNSSQIADIVQVIDDIADQTNLLALNAAIEAARAGEQGRGFSVVADEVRKLAEKTTRATKEIAAMLKQIEQDTHVAIESIEKGTKEVETGKTLARKAGEALQEIIGGTEKVSQIINEVASASQQQASSSEEISRNIEAIASVAHESSTGIQHIAASSGDLAKLTQNLRELIDKFSVNMQKERVSLVR